ncbi:hypothetical protein TWF506_008175 [Arthrobotrys conoides]|uniref:Uncharacterized protein n=1 Tax=Arthrobotrys conoides TaxID=74498 RepID=A0AAN8RXZ6_9PEZI
MIKLLAKYPTKTTPPTAPPPSSAITKVLNIPELLEQILYFVLISPKPDLPATCKTANILRSTSSLWAGTIDSSPSLSALAFRNLRLCSTIEGGGGDLNIPFLQSLSYELSEILQIRYHRGKLIGLKGIKEFQKSQRLKKPRFQNLKKSLGFPQNNHHYNHRHRGTTTKYLKSDVLIISPPPPKTVNTYLHFSGWGCSKWMAWLGAFSRPEDFYESSNTIAFKFWYKITDSSGGNAITGTDLVDALTKLITAFCAFDKGLFEVTHIELSVGNIAPRPFPTAPLSMDHMYRWYLWYPKRLGGLTDRYIFNIVVKVVNGVVCVVGLIYLLFESAGTLTEPWEP